MTERSPDDIARDADPDQPPGPVPDDEREVPLDEPDLGDFEGNLNA
jgi:hypothetical protein